MAQTFTCNILQYESTLRDAGIAEKHVQAQTKALAQIVENNLTTKEDLIAVKKDLFHEIAITKRDTIIWLGSINAAIAAIIIAVMAYLK